MSGYRHSDSGFCPGKVGRKTGFQVVRTPKRGPNGLEDPKDFFLSDDEFESQDTATTSPMKRLSMRFSKIKEIENGKPNLMTTSTPANAITPLPTIPSFSSPIKTTPATQEHKSPLTKLTEKVRNLGWLGKTPSLADTPTEQSDNAKAETQADQQKEETDSKSEFGVETNVPQEQHDDFSVKSLSDNEIDEEIKRAADIGTPIQYKPRRLDSIMETPARHADGDYVVKSSRITKNIALHKSSKNFKFEYQPITNQVDEETTPEPQNDKDIPDEEGIPDEEDSKAADDSSDVSTFKDAEEAPKKEVSEKEEFSVPEPLSLPKPTPVTPKSTPVTPKSTPVTPKPAPVTSKPAQVTPKPKSVTDADIAGMISLKDDRSLKDRKADNLLKRKSTVTVKNYQDKIVTSESEEEDDDDEPIRKSPARLTKTPQKTPLKEKKYIPVQASVKTPTTNISKLTVPEKKIMVTPPVKIPIQEKKFTPTKKQVVTKPLKVKADIPDELLRRSSRTRVAPIARWKNEKIVYKNEKINGVFVKTVEEIVHTNDTIADQSLQESQYTQLKDGSTKKEFVNLSDSETLTWEKPVNASKSKSSAKKNAKVIEKTPAKKSIKAKEPAPAKEKSKKKVQKKSPVAAKPAKRGLKRKLDTPPKTTTKKQKPEPVPEPAVEEQFTDEDVVEEEQIAATEWQTTGEKSLTLSIFEGPGTEKQVERTVAYAPESYKNVTVIKSDEEYFKVGTLFDQDCEFCGGGIIELPAGSKKAVKSNHDTYFIFYVICGTVEVTLSRNAFTVSEGCSFEIPMGNYYQFVNTGSDMAKMMFVQAKYVVIGDNDSDSDEEVSDETSEGN